MIIEELKQLLAEKAYRAYCAARQGEPALQWQYLPEDERAPWFEVAHTLMENSPAPLTVKCQLLTGQMSCYGAQPISFTIYADDTIVGISNAVEEFRSNLESILGEAGTVRSAELPK